MSLFKWFKKEERKLSTCDGCGLEYPHTHLIWINMWDGHFCDTCSEMDENE